MASLLAALACRGSPVGGQDSGVDPGDQETPDSDSEDRVDSDPGPYDGPPNLLIVVIDDMGVDQVGAYGFDAPRPRTPTLDALAAEGLRFDRAYAEASCSPARAAILTGQHPRRAGIGTWLRNEGAHELPLDAVTLAEVLARAPVPYTSHAVGKWHLSTLGSPTGLDHPVAQGFATYRGSPNNLNNVASYYSYDKRLPDGSWVTSERYITTDEVDDALQVIAQTAPPWFVYLAFHAPHTPIERPPDALLAEPLPEDVSPLDTLFATMEAMDTEIGRLLDGLGAQRDHTVVVVLSDNGAANITEDGGHDPGADVKGTLFEGGVRVPWIMAGPGVARGASTSSLVHATDLLPTAAELAGVVLTDDERASLDGVSFAPLLADPSAVVREHVYVERFKPNGDGPWYDDQRAVITDAHKLVHTRFLRPSLYDIEGFGDGPDRLDPDTVDSDDRALRESLEPLLQAEETSLGLR